jgi:hypothetical protein
MACPASFLSLVSQVLTNLKLLRVGRLCNTGSLMHTFTPTQTITQLISQNDHCNLIDSSCQWSMQLRSRYSLFYESSLRVLAYAGACLPWLKNPMPKSTAFCSMGNCCLKCAVSRSSAAHACRHKHPKAH